MRAAAARNGRRPTTNLPRAPFIPRTQQVSFHRPFLWSRERAARQRATAARKFTPALAEKNSGKAGIGAQLISFDFDHGMI
jgi:hypothetical protein